MNSFFFNFIPLVNMCVQCVSPDTEYRGASSCRVYIQDVIEQDFLTSA